MKQYQVNVDNPTNSLGTLFEVSEAHFSLNTFCGETAIHLWYTCIATWPCNIVICDRILDKLNVWCIGMYRISRSWGTKRLEKHIFKLCLRKKLTEWTICEVSVYTWYIDELHTFTVFAVKWLINLMFAFKWITYQLRVPPWQFTIVMSC